MEKLIVPQQKRLLIQHICSITKHTNLIMLSLGLRTCSRTLPGSTEAYNKGSFQKQSGSRVAYPGSLVLGFTFNPQQASLPQQIAIQLNIQLSTPSQSGSLVWFPPTHFLGHRIFAHFWCVSEHHFQGIMRGIRGGAGRLKADPLPVPLVAKVSIQITCIVTHVKYL